MNASAVKLYTDIVLHLPIHECQCSQTLRGVSKKFVDKCNNLFIYGRIVIKIDRKILQHSTIKLPVNNCSGWYTSRIPRRHRNQKSLPRRNSNSLKLLLHSIPYFSRNPSFITTWLWHNLKQSNIRIHAKWYHFFIIR